MTDVSPGPLVQRVQRVRHELKRRELTVSAVQPLGPGFVAVTFAGESLADFVSLSFDDHLKLMVLGPGGEPVRRDYTPRRFSTAERSLTIEFALHGTGAASDWARRARVGDPVTIGGPRGSMILPDGLDWQLLVGDDTALPAIARRLEDLPASARVIVVAAVDDPADRRDFGGAASVDVHWVDSADALPAAVGALRLPPGDGFAWGGGEAAVMAAVRRVLVDVHRLPREALRLSAYWKRGASDYHQPLD